MVSNLDWLTLLYVPAEHISDELRQKAVRTTIATVSGAYQTVLVSYFINRDFFPSLMKVRLVVYSAHLREHELMRSRWSTNTKMPCEPPSHFY